MLLNVFQNKKNMGKKKSFKKIKATGLDNSTQNAGDNDKLIFIGMVQRFGPGILVRKFEPSL